MRRLGSIVRGWLLPVHRKEWALLLPLVGLALLICINYYLLRCLKDSLLIAEIGAGASIIPFLKLWAVLPTTVLVAFLITHSLKRTPWIKLFSRVVVGFALYFLLFALVLYPMRQMLQPAVELSWLPKGFAPLRAALRHWPLTTFYIAAELWKIHVLMVLYWGLVNQLTPLDQAKRFYNLLLVSGSLAALIAGPLSTSIASRGGPWEASLLKLTAVAVLCCVGISLLLRRLPPPKQAAEKKPPLKQALRGATHPILIGLGCLIIADQIAFNITEVLWKEALFQQCRTPENYCAFMGRITTWTGLLAVVSTLLFSGNLIRRCSWRLVALLPVILALLTAGAFFSLLLAGSPLAIAAGALHNGLLRASRDALSDPTKQLVYRSLSPETQVRGKPLVCGICPTVGKTAGSLVQQGGLLSWPTLLAAAPFFGLVVLSAIALYGGIVWRLAGQMREETRERPLPTA